MNDQGLNIYQKSAREAESKYDDFLESFKKLSRETDIDKIKTGLSDIVSRIVKSQTSEKIPLLLYTSKILSKDYIYAHSVNVCILSVKIGLKIKLDEARVKDLGFLALTHAKSDIKFPKELFTTVKSDKKIEEIIRLVDVYDGLTHPPEYRQAAGPCETLGSIVRAGTIFDRDLLRVLLEELTIFPIGSWVELCTGEIARVVRVNNDFLLRPTVEILIDRKGGYLENVEKLDLSQSMAYISRPLNENEIRGLENRKQ